MVLDGGTNIGGGEYVAVIRYEWVKGHLPCYQNYSINVCEHQKRVIIIRTLSIRPQ